MSHIDRSDVATLHSPPLTAKITNTIVRAPPPSEDSSSSYGGDDDDVEQDVVFGSDNEDEDVFMSPSEEAATESVHHQQQGQRRLSARKQRSKSMNAVLDLAGVDMAEAFARLAFFAASSSSPASSSPSPSLSRRASTAHSPLTGGGGGGDDGDDDRGRPLTRKRPLDHDEETEGLIHQHHSQSSDPVAHSPNNDDMQDVDNHLDNGSAGSTGVSPNIRKDIQITIPPARPVIPLRLRSMSRTSTSPSASRASGTPTATTCSATSPETPYWPFHQTPLREVPSMSPLVTFPSHCTAHNVISPTRYGIFGASATVAAASSSPVISPGGMQSLISDSSRDEPGVLSQPQPQDEDMGSYAMHRDSGDPHAHSNARIVDVLSQMSSSAYTSSSVEL